MKKNAGEAVVQSLRPAFATILSVVKRMATSGFQM